MSVLFFLWFNHTFMTYIIWKLYDSRDENISLISIRYKCMTRRTKPRDCYCSFWRRPLTNNHLGKLWKTVRPVTRNRIFATTRFLTENLSSVGQMHSEHRVKWDVTIQWLYPSIPPARRCMYTLTSLNAFLRLHAQNHPKHRENMNNLSVWQMHGRL